MWHKNNADNKPSGRVIVRECTGAISLDDWVDGRGWDSTDDDWCYVDDSAVTHWHEIPPFEEEEST